MSNSKIQFSESLKKSLAAMYPNMELSGEHSVTLSSLSSIMWDEQRKVAANKYGDEVVELCVSALGNINEYALPVNHLRLCYAYSYDMWVTFDLACGVTTIKKPYVPHVILDTTMYAAGFPVNKVKCIVDEFELMSCAAELVESGVKEFMVKF